MKKENNHQDIPLSLSAMPFPLNMQLIMRELYMTLKLNLRIQSICSTLPILDYPNFTSSKLTYPHTILKDLVVQIMN